MSKKNPFPRYEEEGEVQHLRAQVRDLKARLKAARSVGAAMQERAPAALLAHITDLRVRDWRRP